MSVEISKIRENISKVIVGKDDKISLVLTALLAGGHVLLEDVPGTGKTTLAKALAASVDCDYKRIQFTPDLLPTDITGLSIYNKKTEAFEYNPGPVITNICLADEINRATPRTQSALLEAMEERQLTVDGVTRVLPKPFIVIATQNPVETAGTFPLPEAQLDRFMMEFSLGYPEEEAEITILKIRTMVKTNGDADETIGISDRKITGNVSPVCSASDILELQEEASKVFIHDDILKYIVSIAKETRNHSEISLGISPRGTVAMINAAKAYAYINGRSYVLPDDVKVLAVPVFAHRLFLYGKANTKLKQELLTRIVNAVPVPTEDFSR